MAGRREVPRSQENQRKKCFPGICQTPSSSRTFGRTTAPRRSCRSRGSRRSTTCSCSPWPPDVLHRHLCQRRRPTLWRCLRRPSRVRNLLHLRRQLRTEQMRRRRPGLCRRGSPTTGWCVRGLSSCGCASGRRSSHIVPSSTTLPISLFYSIHPSTHPSFLSVICLVSPRLPFARCCRSGRSACQWEKT